MKTVYIASFVKMPTIITCWMRSKWKIPSLKQDILTGNSRKYGKGSHKHESSNCHQQAIQILTEIPKSTEDVYKMVKSYLTEVQSQNGACLIKIISCLRYLDRQGFPPRGHGNEQDSNFKIS